MGLFDFLKGAQSLANKTFNPAYSQNKDFLEAACAASALMAGADGSIDPGEQSATIQLLATHKTLGSIYSTSDIRSTADSMFGRASSASGKAALVRELTDIKGNSQMCEDVYFIALDVAAQGGVSDKEEAAAARLAEIMGVKVQNVSAAGF